MLFWAWIVDFEGGKEWGNLWAELAVVFLICRKFFIFARGNVGGGMFDEAV